MPVTPPAGVVNMQATPQLAVDEQGAGDMSDNGGEILSPQRLEERLNREEAINDDDDDVFSTGIPAQHGTGDYSAGPEDVKADQNLLNLLYLIAEVSLTPPTFVWFILMKLRPTGSSKARGLRSSRC